MSESLKFDESEFTKELRIDTCSFDSKVRITHIPTGLVEESNDTPVKFYNKTAALSRLMQRLKKLDKKPIAVTPHE